MTFMEYMRKPSSEHLRQGQGFINWITVYKGWVGNDPELFYSTNDQNTWNLINKKYSSYLTDLC